MQQRDEFEWDDDNEGKLAARHGVDRYEAEEAATDPRASVKRIGADRVGNPEYVLVGKTDDGRILFMSPPPADRAGQLLRTAFTSSGEAAACSRSTCSSSVKTSAMRASTSRWSSPTPAIPMTNWAGFPPQSIGSR